MDASRDESGAEHGDGRSRSSDDMRFICSAVRCRAKIECIRRDGELLATKRHGDIVGSGIARESEEAFTNGGASILRAWYSLVNGPNALSVTNDKSSTRVNA